MLFLNPLASVIPPGKRPDRPGKNGVALIIVLAFVVLLSGVVMALFSRTIANRQLSNSSFHQAKADELARSMLELVTGNLKQEIANGSDIQTVGNTKIFLPKTSDASLPVRNGIGAGYPSLTLVRISSRDAIASPAVDFQASELKSTGTSGNGRTITLSRWNRHYLIPRDETKYSGTNSTKVGTDPVSTFVAPDWVFVTGSGPARQPLTAPDSAVVGRYAYAMYDEGALLDVNVAGAPYSSTSGTLPTEYAPKGAVAFADLTALGISATSQITVGINNLVGWRNFASLQPGGNLQGNFTFTSGISGTYRDLVLSNTNGFLKVANLAVNGRTDQAFLNRQTLIAFSRAGTSGIIQQDALQYLGTFSRAVTAPSWIPSTPSGSSIDYAGEANSSSAPNRNLVLYRFQNAVSNIPHYDDAGNVSTWNAQAGDSVLQRRFSLSKLKWLTYKGPSASLASGDSLYNAGGTAEAIQACFGLHWNAGSAPDVGAYWEYWGSTGSTPVSTIKTLDDVASEATPREPNFFELLKAGILCGSLGGNPGPASAGIGDAYSIFKAPGANYDLEGPVGEGFDTYSADKNRHVFQVGANVIDQADTDSYPTALFYGSAADKSAASPEARVYHTVYGDENLPLVHRLYGFAAEYPAGTANGYVQVELWNPHQAQTSSTGAIPTRFRTRAYGMAKLDTYWVSSPNAPVNGATSYFGTTDMNKGLLYFTDTPGKTTSSFYNGPLALTGTNVDETLTDSACWDPTHGSTTTAPTYSSCANYAAIAIGSNTFERTTISGSSTNQLQTWVGPYAMTVSLECYDGTMWRPYGFFSRISGPMMGSNPWKSPFPTEPTFYGITKVQGSGLYSFYRADLRTDRFSAGGARLNGGFPTYGWQTTMESGADSGKTRFLESPYEVYWPWGSGYGFTYIGPFGMADVVKWVPTMSATYGSQGWYNVQDAAVVAWSMNLENANFNAYGDLDGYNAYYADPDGIVRPGDSFRRNSPTTASKYSAGNGCPLLHANASGLTSTAHARRPVILNRPFRSVGELGYVFRDLPYKSLDFWSAKSADAALLDLFSLNDTPLVVAGHVNPNHAPAPVLQAIFSGGMKNDASTAMLSSTDALSVANAIVAYNTSGTGSPITNRADLVSKLSDVINNALSLASDKGNKSYGEAPLRALSEVTNTRTWNLMIDLVAQTGAFPPHAKTLDQFVVYGERRYWLHVAIDRYTGAVVDQQIEAVYE